MTNDHPDVQTDDLQASRREVLLTGLAEAPHEAAWEAVAPLLSAAEGRWALIPPGRNLEKVRAAAREREVVRMTARLWAALLRARLD